MNNITSLLKNKKIATAFLAFAIICVLSLFWWGWDSQIASKIELSIAPSSSKITLNGKSFSNGTHNITPGKYKLVAEKDGFAPKTEEFEIKSKETKKIILALQQNNGQDDWYSKNEQDDIIRSGATYKKIHDDTQNIIKNNPIASLLPYTDTLSKRYKIEYILDGNNKSKINNLKITIDECINPNSKIDSVEFRRKSALRWLDENYKDSEKNKYNIIFATEPCIY